MQKFIVNTSKNVKFTNNKNNTKYMNKDTSSSIIRQSYWTK